MGQTEVGEKTTYQQDEIRIRMTNKNPVKVHLFSKFKARTSQADWFFGGCSVLTIAKLCKVLRSIEGPLTHDLWIMPQSNEKMLSNISIILIKVFCLLLVSFGTLGNESWKGDQVNLPCSKDVECLESVNGSFCDETKSQCICSDDTPVFINETLINVTKCFPVANLNESECDFTLQCNRLTNYTECKSGKCVCQKNYVQEKGLSCRREEENHLIPIIVGSMLAVAIIGTLAIYFYKNRGKNDFSS